MRVASFVVLPACVALTAAFAARSSGVPQEETTPPGGREVPTFAVGTSAVTLDIVVRDKKDRIVPDLKASDFEVYEDGVLQQIESFEVFGRPPAEEPEEEKKAPAPAATAAAAPAPSAPAPADESTTRPQVIAFVFDRLSAEARNIAHKAALTYLDGGHVDGDLVGIFSIDLALQTLQPFTTDPTLIRAGIVRAASQGNTAFGNSRSQTRDLVEAAMAGGAAADAATGANPGQGGSSQDIGSTAATGALTQAIANIQAGMLRSFETLERDQQGYASSNALLSVVNGLKSLPGRKTVVFFSEGLAIPSNVQAQFRSVIATANRSNVSVYAMDAAGLRVESLTKETREEMLQAQERRMRQLASGRDVATGAMTKDLERNEDLLRLNPESGLGQLARETGGFLIQNTNDAASAFRRMEEDMRFHYLLGYTPTNDDYDGEFRTIQVKVKRGGLHVQSREGYLALRTIEREPVRTFEAPALARLEAKKKPHDFPLQVTGLSFPTSDRPGLAPVLVRIPATAVEYTPDKNDPSGQKMQRGDLTVLVRIKDQAGAEADRLSQHYPLSVPAASLDAARQGDILFYREAELTPGTYTVEAVGYDAVSEKASVSTSTLDVPAAEPGHPRLSSVMVVGRAEKVPAGEQAQGNPLYYGETILYPSMGDPIHKSTSKGLGFFFTVYGVDTSSTPAKAVLEVFRGDTPAGKVGTELPAPDASGRIQYAGALPLQTFPPGSYRLKVTASTAAGSVVRETPFTVAE